MDPASLGMGIAGLFGLFTTCMQCFEYIQYGRRFGKDYEQSVLKLDVSRLRLQRWAESLELLSNDPKQQVLVEARLSKHEKDIARTLLGSIAEAFENAETLSKGYEQRQKLINPAASEEEAGLAVIESDEDVSSANTRWKSMHLKMKARIQSRQKNMGTLRKAKWALYEKKRFDDLVRDVKDLADALIENFPKTILVQDRLAIEEVKEVTEDAQDRLLLKSAAEETDVVLQRAVEQAILVQDGQQFSGIKLSGQSKVFLGNDVAYGVKVKGNSYSNLVIDGNAVVHAGNVYRGRGQAQIEFSQETQTRRAMTDIGNSQSLIRRWSQTWSSLNQYMCKKYMVKPHASI
ncbi:hypothetical protein LTR64_001950 [Lithohypha guttulata]|uniref:uncharacterized protein n=1 Tax=Lithohypha guttulata TaxID=1690604 RepID=UPI00315C91CC